MLAKPPLPVLCSRAIPFAIVCASDFGGPRSRQRVALRSGDRLPPWLDALLRHHPAGEHLVAVARGRARPGATIRIRTIVAYPPTRTAPETTYVYVEEPQTGASVGEPAPFQVVLCPLLPGVVRFVEVTRPRPASHMKLC
jgi:hypothetical protein